MADDTNAPLLCREGCGACCIAPSISSPIPGMPQGKPAGIRCLQLAPDDRCLVHGQPERPVVCRSFPAMSEHCGSDRKEAMYRLAELERLTASGPDDGGGA